MDYNAISPLKAAATRFDLTVDALRDAILSGRLQPGQALVERQIAEMLGVSKTPVREALIALTVRGLVTASRGPGTSVRQLTPEDVYRIYQVRVLLEPWAASQTAERRLQENVDSATAALNDATPYLDASEPPPEMILINRRFHRALYAGCGNELVVKMLDDVQDLTGLAIATVLWGRNSAIWRREYDEHQAILQAAAVGDAERAGSLMRSHIEASLATVAKMTTTETSEV